MAHNRSYKPEDIAFPDQTIVLTRFQDEHVFSYLII